MIMVVFLNNLQHKTQRVQRAIILTNSIAFWRVGFD